MVVPKLGGPKSLVVRGVRSENDAAQLPPRPKRHLPKKQTREQIELRKLTFKKIQSMGADELSKTVELAKSTHDIGHTTSKACIIF